MARRYCSEGPGGVHAARSTGLDIVTLGGAEVLCSTRVCDLCGAEHARPFGAGVTAPWRLVRVTALTGGEAGG